MKLIDADKLREQIEKLLQDREITLRERNTYLRVLNIIDEAPEISPIDGKELDKVVENSWALYEYAEHPRGLYYTCYRDGFKAGANWQAERDKLTWDDINNILRIDFELSQTHNIPLKEYCEEVLKQFNEQKQK